MQTQNIVFGFGAGNTGKIKLGTYGQSEGSAADLGRSEGGLKVAFERTMKEVETDQDYGPVASKEVMRKAKISVKLVEATVATLAKALGLSAGQVSGTTLSLSNPSNTGEQYWTLYCNVDGPAGGTRKYTFPKVAVSGNAMHEYKRDGVTTVEFECTVLWDATQSAGSEMGTVADSASDTTAPTVALTSPSSGGTVVAAAKTTVVWTITEANVVDQNTVIYGKTFQIFDISSGTAPALIAGTIVYDPTAKTVTFTPTSNWAAAGQKLMTMVDTGLSDQAGNRLAAVSIDHFVSA